MRVKHLFLLAALSAATVGAWAITPLPVKMEEVWIWAEEPLTVSGLKVPIGTDLRYKVRAGSNLSRSAILEHQVEEMRFPKRGMRWKGHQVLRIERAFPDLHVHTPTRPKGLPAFIRCNSNGGSYTLFFKPKDSEYRGAATEWREDIYDIAGCWDAEVKARLGAQPVSLRGMRINAGDVQYPPTGMKAGEAHWRLDRHEQDEPDRQFVNRYIWLNRKGQVASFTAYSKQALRIGSCHYRSDSESFEFTVYSKEGRFIAEVWYGKPLRSSQSESAYDDDKHPCRQPQTIEPELAQQMLTG